MLATTFWSVDMNQVRALVLTGYGLNCDYETAFSLKLAGAASNRVHINRLIDQNNNDSKEVLADYHILVFGGGFSWADDHGAGVLMAAKIRRHLGEQIKRFINDRKLIIGICNGFQALVNLGLLPGFDACYNERRTALINNDTGNFIDAWATLRVNDNSPSVFTKGLEVIDLPVRHGEGKFYAAAEDINRLLKNKQVVLQYSRSDGSAADGRWPDNPNGSLSDIAGICDSTGRVFGLMPHPEAFNHYTNHPAWTRTRQKLARQGKTMTSEEGDGIKIFRNAVRYVETELLED